MRRTFVPPQMPTRYRVTRAMRSVQSVRPATGQQRRALPAHQVRTGPRWVLVPFGVACLLALIVVGLVGWGWGVGSAGSGPGAFQLVAGSRGDGPPTAPGAPFVTPQGSARLPENFGVAAVELEKNRRISDAIGRVRSATVALEYEAGDPRLPHRVASGVVINEGGEVLSVRIDPPADRSRTSIVASDASGHQHPARWVAADPETGLTLLRIEAKGLKPIRQAAGDPTLGSECFLIGNPYGLGHSVTRGHIAGLRRQFSLGSQTLAGLIQIQASFHPGDSGAPLADLDGGWLGLFRGVGLAPLAAGVGRDNDLGFAIPARNALWVADQLRAAGKVDRAYLGIKFAPDGAIDRPLDPAHPAEREEGAKVAEVMPDSPAAASGLRQGDRVVGMDDSSVTATNDLTDRLERTAAGVKLALDYIRGTTRNRVTIQSTSRPPSPPVGPGAGAAIKATGGPAGNVPLNPESGRISSKQSPEAIIEQLRDRVNLLEKRVEQLERAKGSPRSAPKP